MVYAQASTGYRGGGINPRPFFPSQEQSFQPETITAYEAGFKSDLFDRKLRFNATAFYNVYRNIILTSSFCADLAPLGQASPCLRPTNTGNAHVKGIEFETSVHPAAGLSFDGSLSYLDFRYTSVNTADTGVTMNMVTPYTPKWKWNFGVQYEIPGVLHGKLTPRFDGSYQSHVYSDPQNLDGGQISSTLAIPPGASGVGLGGPLLPGGYFVTQNGGGGSIPTLTVSDRIDGYFLGNAHLAWVSDSKELSVVLEVQNLFNQYYFTTKYNQFNSSGTISGAPGMPRTWSVTVRHKF